jgi:hypothetical protein
MIKSSLSHVALSAPLFAACYGAALLGSQWAAALGVALYWAGRELAQSMRPSAPLSFNWTATSTLNLAAPAVAALIAAALVTVI